MSDLNQCINPETLSTLKDTMGEIFDDLKTMFLEDSPALLDQIKIGLKNNQVDDISMAAHTLKSSAKNMGADTLADYCNKIEHNTETVSGSELLELYQCAKAEMHRVEKYLRGTSINSG